MLESQLLEMGVTKEAYNIDGRDDDIYCYTAPKGYHFENKDGVNYGNMVYASKRLPSTYFLIKDKKNEHFSKKKL